MKSQVLLRVVYNFASSIFSGWYL